MIQRAKVGASLMGMFVLCMSSTAFAQGSHGGEGSRHLKGDMEVKEFLAWQVGFNQLVLKRDWRSAEEEADRRWGDSWCSQPFGPARGVHSTLAVVARRRGRLTQAARCIMAAQSRASRLERAGLMFELSMLVKKTPQASIPKLHQELVEAMRCGENECCLQDESFGDFLSAFSASETWHDKPKTFHTRTKIATTLLRRAYRLSPSQAVAKRLIKQGVYTKAQAMGVARSPLPRVVSWSFQAKSKEEVNVWLRKKLGGQKKEGVQKLTWKRQPHRHKGWGLHVVELTWSSSKECAGPEFLETFVVVHDKGSARWQVIRAGAHQENGCGGYGDSGGLVASPRLHMGKKTAPVVVVQYQTSSYINTGCEPAFSDTHHTIMCDLSSSSTECLLHKTVSHYSGDSGGLGHMKMSYQKGGMKFTGLSQFPMLAKALRPYQGTTLTLFMQELVRIHEDFKIEVVP